MGSNLNLKPKGRKVEDHLIVIKSELNEQQCKVYINIWTYHPMDPVYGPPHGPGPPWTTPNFQREIAPVNMKIYQRSGYEKHRLVFIAYALEGLSRKSGLLLDRNPI